MNYATLYITITHIGPELLARYHRPNEELWLFHSGHRSISLLLNWPIDRAKLFSSTRRFQAAAGNGDHLHARPRTPLDAERVLMMLRVGGCWGAAMSISPFSIPRFLTGCLVQKARWHLSRYVELHWYLNWRIGLNYEYTVEKNYSKFIP